MSSRKTRTISGSAAPTFDDPESQRAAKSTIEIFYRTEFADGDKSALMLAIFTCAICKIPMPDWVADAVKSGYLSIKNAEAKSWDDVFGKPFKKGSSIAAIRKKRRLLLPVIERVSKLSSAGEAIDEQLFAKVGQEFHISGSLVRDYYYEAKNHLFPSRDDEDE